VGVESSYGNKYGENSRLSGSLAFIVDSGYSSSRDAVKLQSVTNKRNRSGQGVRRMRYTILGLMIAVLPLTSRAGPIARQFASGYDGVVWGSSLVELVGIHPRGQHYFAVGSGVRDYGLPDEKTMFGILRSHMQVVYFLDETSSVVSASLTFPFEQRQKLLGTLIVSFGPHQSMFVKGISTYYAWRRDDGVGIVVRATLDPTFGILELAISGPNTELSKQDHSDCTPQSNAQKSKK
jgi:hypothetical protein